LEIKIVTINKGEQGKLIVIREKEKKQHLKKIEG